MNCENRKGSEMEDIIKNIEIKSYLSECKDIGIQWKKNCPRCGKEQVYSSKESLRHAMYRNALCNPCRANERKTRPSSDQWKRICSKCKSEILYKSVKSYLFCKRHNTKCRKCATKESAKYADKHIFHTEEYRYKMSQIFKKLRNSKSYGESFKQKCRENKLKQIQQQGTHRTYNKIACNFINKVNNLFGWNLQHAENGGEIQIIGYSLDGYDKNKNIVFEYDEPKHHIEFHKKRDKKREERIINFLHPIMFIRYDEKNKKLIDVLNQKEIVCPLL